MASTTMPTSSRFSMSSPGFGSPTPENRLQVAKDASPATSTFPGVRSPLDSIGTNAGGSTFGLRQRRQGADGGEVLNANEKMKAPPRASLTMSMASKASNTIPSSSGKNSVRSVIGYLQFISVIRSIDRDNTHNFFTCCHSPFTGRSSRS